MQKFSTPIAPVGSAGALSYILLLHHTHTHTHTPHTHVLRPQSNTQACTHTHTHTHTGSPRWQTLEPWYISMQIFYKLWLAFLPVLPTNCSQNFWCMSFIFNPIIQIFTLHLFSCLPLKYHVSYTWLYLQVYFCSRFFALKITADIVGFCMINCFCFSSSCFG